MDLSGLVARSQAGETAAFGELTRHYQDMAFGYALALLSDFHLAQDVTQESFLAAYLGVSSLQDPAAFPAWLRGIVRHQCGRCAAATRTRSRWTTAWTCPRYPPDRSRPCCSAKGSIAC